MEVKYLLCHLTALLELNKIEMITISKLPVCFQLSQVVYNLTDIQARFVHGHGIFSLISIFQLVFTFCNYDNNNNN